MKLIIKEYLASLKERDELDALLPDLLSQMGLNVISTPSIGTSQKGVDIAAVGKIDSGQKRVYLISIKQENLSRLDWDGPSPQCMRPSLNQIIDAYIPTWLPEEYKDLPISICLCIGGIIKQEVRADVTAYENRNKTDRISFEEWNGDFLAEKILKYLFSEKLIPSLHRSLLQKTLALVDEPSTSHDYFLQLLKALIRNTKKELKYKLITIRQMYLCLSILLSWSNEINNSEVAFLAAESTLLFAWELSKSHIHHKYKNAQAMSKTLVLIVDLYIKISDKFIDKINEHGNKTYALSMGVKPQSPIDANIKLFDILGRISLNAIWYYWREWYLHGNETIKNPIVVNKISKTHVIVKDIIKNNPILYSPYKEDQIIDISLAVWFLALDKRNLSFINFWFSEMLERCFFNYVTHKRYPCYFNQYEQLISHPLKITDEYRKSITTGSILYPMISLLSAIYNFDGPYKEIQDFNREYLKHCAFQLWFPDKDSEDNYYTNKNEHGATLFIDNIDIPKNELIELILKECDMSTSYKDLTAVKRDWWPIILLASRHFRHPVPVQFFRDFISND